MYFELSLFFHGLQAVTVFFYVLLRMKPLNSKVSGRDKMAACVTAAGEAQENAVVNHTSEYMR